MKYILILALACSATAVQAQVKKDSVAHRIDSANNNTPLLSYNDVLYMRDSVLQNAPYKFAPIIDGIMQFLTNRVLQRAAEYNLKAGKK